MAWVGQAGGRRPERERLADHAGLAAGQLPRRRSKDSPPGDPYLPDTHSTPVVIGQTTKYRMDIWDTAYTLAPGHRLRLWLSSSDAPTHEPLDVAGRNLIFHDSVYPSRLILGRATPGPRLPQGARVLRAAEPVRVDPR